MSEDECGQCASATSSVFLRLVRFRPDVGLIMFRNLAIGLGAKLGRAPVGGLAALKTD